MSQPGAEPSAETADPPIRTAGWANALGRVGVDWWATIVGGVIAVLAATDLLPKIPW